MSTGEARITVLSAIRSAIKESPNRQATLKELYVTVPKLLGRGAHPATIRSIINRSLDTRNKQAPYPILFRRVTSATYATYALTEK